MALAGLTGGKLLAGTLQTPAASLADSLSHFAPTAKRVIFLHMAGAPSQLELFDYKPALNKLHDQPCPESLLKGK